MDEAVVLKVLLGIVPVLLAITVHEVSHGWAALHFGDHTAQLQGRLTLNPVRHIDPVGTIAVPLLAMVLGGFIFGWAKPVPVDYRNLKNPRKDMIWIAAAGPASNFVMAVIWGWLLHFSQSGMAGTFGMPLEIMARMGVLVNFGLMVLNLLPLPPLDGGRILVGVLPPRPAEAVARIEPWGFFILLGLLVTGLLDVVLMPIYAVAGQLLSLFF